MKKKIFLQAILLLFFISGMCGLVYQVIWVRMFGLVFGNTLFASSTVLSSFMAGLAAGSFFSGKYLTHRNDGLRLYAFVEVLIGIYAIMIPVALKVVSGLYGWTYQTFHASFEVLTIFRFCLAFIILFIPCMCMGATLPIVTKYISNSHVSTNIIPGKLYGVNTIGAVIGCFAAGFVLIKAVGIWQTNMIAAIGNCIVAAGAFILFKKGTAQGLNKKEIPSGAEKEQQRAVSQTKILPEGLHSYVLVSACGLSGFAALSLEIVWIKALARTFQMAWTYTMDAYAYVVMLGTLLSGIGVGSYLVSVFVLRIQNCRRWLCGTQVFLGVSVIASIFILQNPLGFQKALISFVNMPLLSGVTSLFIQLLGVQAMMQLLFALIVIFVPAVLMGVAFPLFAIAFYDVAGSMGKCVGVIYSANTVGGICGSLLSGFVLIPFIGLFPAIALAACIYFIISLAILFITEEKGTIKWVTAGLIGSIAVVSLVMAELDYSHFLKSTLSSSGGREKIVYSKEHADGEILVTESPVAGKAMFNDGVIVAASAGQNLFSHIFPAHLISLLLKGPREICVIGFGCGITSGSMLLYDEVTSLTGVEINRGILEPAKKYFSEANNNVFANNKLNLIIQDGKNFITMTDTYFDVIYSCPSLPQANQGSAGLFTKEFFTDCKKKLNKGGFQCLWIPLHMYSPEEFLTIVKTFIEVYPHVSLWHPPQTEVSIGLAYLIGSDEAVRPDYQRIANQLNRSGIRQDINRLEESGFRTPEEFISMFAMGEKSLRSITASIKRINTDNHPVVEFYNRTGDLMQSAIMSKIKLIELLGKNSEDPYYYVQNNFIENNDSLKNRLAKLYIGKQYLMMGHAACTYKELLSVTGQCPPEIDAQIRQYYSQASALLPENIFLNGLFNRSQ